MSNHVTGWGNHCNDCKHSLIVYDCEPCASCRGNNHWEADTPESSVPVIKVHNAPTETAEPNNEREAAKASEGSIPAFLANATIEELAALQATVTDYVAHCSMSKLVKLYRYTLALGGNATSRAENWPPYDEV